MRFLSILFVPPSAPPASTLFRFLDIVMTAALVAGGSDSLHQLVRAFEGFVRTKPGGTT